MEENGASHVRFTGTLRHTDTVFDVTGEGNGPIDAFFNAIHGQKMDRFTFVDYKEHAVQSGSDSMAVAYIQLRDETGRDIFGVGMDHNINLAPLRGILSAINRAWQTRHRGLFDSTPARRKSFPSFLQYILHFPFPGHILWIRIGA